MLSSTQSNISVENVSSITVADYARDFLALTLASRLEESTKNYYRNGVRLFLSSPIAEIPLTALGRRDIDCLSFGSPANTNNALRALSKMLSIAVDDGMIARKPKIKMVKQRRRHSMLTAEWEALLLPVAKPLLRDVIVLMRDTGLRNRRELFRVRIELIRWNDCLIEIVDSKTQAGIRLAPASPRAIRILRTRAAGRTSGWIFPSKRSASGHLTTVQKLWREALDTLKGQGIHVPDDLVLYCARHDFGTSAYKATKNIFAVMEAMGHKDVKSAQQYQHQDISEVTQFLRQRA